MHVLAALSGGVDSSCALKMALDEGHQVTGVTLSLWDYSQPQKFGSCCASRDVMDARRVCHQFGVPFYVLDASTEFRAKVVNNFIEEFEDRRTPSPCIRCNSFVKFQRLAQTATEMGAQKIMTGHYAQVRVVNGRPMIARGADEAKDQSYFLFGLPAEILEKLSMPLGGMTKPQVRALAQQWGLAVAEKPDSQELCFLGSDKPADFLKKHGTPGYQSSVQVFDAVSGQKLGENEQGAFFTLGQRRGTVHASGERQYVVKIEPGKVYLGPESMLMQKSVRLRECVWHSDPRQFSDLTIKLRSRHQGTQVVGIERGVIQGVESALVQLATPERAITAGQAGVVYAGDLVVGGGWITHE